MADVKKRVVEIDVKAQKIGELKEQVKELTRLMDSLDKESLEYNRTVDMLVDAEEELNTVMKVGKSQLSAQEGSYNALVNKMAALKKAQKAVTDEASRMRLGDKIREINDELKRIDANNGVYVRNVGDYENAVKKALKTPQQELKALRVQLAQLTEGTAEYNATFARMAQLTHDVTEQQEMLRWSSADLGDILGNIAGVATSIAGGFSAVNALGGLLGISEDEDLEKAMLQAQRFLQLIQGLEQLEQLADKIKGLWQGIKNFANSTTIGTAALTDFQQETEKAEAATTGAASAINTNAAATNTGAEATARATTELEKYAEMLALAGIEEEDYTKRLISKREALEEEISSMSDLMQSEDWDELGEHVQEGFMRSWDDLHKQLREVNADLDKTGDTMLKMRSRMQEATTATVANTTATELNHKGLKGRLATMILNSKQNKLSVAEINAMTTAQLANTAATVALGGAWKILKTAMASTVIGGIIVALGALLNLLGKGAKALWGWISGANKAKEQTEALKTAFDTLNESLEGQEKSWERQEMLMEAQGKSYAEIYEARKKNLKAQLAEVQALLASQKAIANDIGQRKLQKKKYDDFRETLDELVAREKELKQSIDDLDYENYINGVRERKKAEEEAAAAAKKAAEQAKAAHDKQKEEADKLYKSLIEHYKTEQQKLKEKYEKEKELLEKYGKDTTLLTKKYEEDKTAIVMKEAEARRKATEEYNKLIVSGMDNPSLEYFVSQLEDAADKYNAFMTANSKVARDEGGANTLEGYAEVIKYISQQYGINIKSITELDAWLKIVTKEYEDAKKALEDYKNQIKETTSAELVAELEAQVDAIQRFTEQKQLEAEQEYQLYESSNNYYIDFGNNYISQMYKRWEAEDAIHQMRMANLQEMADKYKEASENTMLTEEARVEALKKYKEIEQQITNETAEHNINVNLRETESIDNYTSAVQDSLGGISQILGDVASAWETSIQAQVDAGEISEEEGEKQMESMRGIQSAIALINALSSAVSSYNSLASIPFVGVPLGIAAAAAALASGLAQVAAINKVKKGDNGSGSSTRYAEVTPTMPSDYSPQMIQNATGLEEQQNLANALTKSPIKAYVVESEMTEAQKKADRRNAESTF